MYWQRWHRSALSLALASGLVGVAVYAFRNNVPQWEERYAAAYYHTAVTSPHDLDSISRLKECGAAGIPWLVRLLDADSTLIQSRATDVLLEVIRDDAASSQIKQPRLEQLVSELTIQLPSTEAGRRTARQLLLTLVDVPLAASDGNAQLQAQAAVLLAEQPEYAFAESLAEPRDVPEEEALIATENVLPDATASLATPHVVSPPVAQKRMDVEPSSDVISPTPLAESNTDPTPIAIEAEIKPVPPDRFFPVDASRLRRSITELAPSPPVSNEPPLEVAPLVVDRAMLKRLPLRSVIKQLHGLPELAGAAHEELRRRGFSDDNITWARKLDDPRPSERLELIAALPRLSQFDAATWLAELTEDPDLNVRVAARNLLTTSRNPTTQRELRGIFPRR